MASSPTKRTLDWIRREYPDAIVEVVERWNPYAKIRQDLFGVFDLIVAHPGVEGVPPVLGGQIEGLQVTSRANVSSRIKKIIDSPKAKTWLRAGGSIEVWGWGQTGPRGKKKRWTAKVHIIHLNQLGEVKSADAGEVA